MSPQRQAFINVYLGEAKGNGTKAAILAGYSEHTASVQASQLLRQPEVQAAIQKRLEKHDLRTDAILQRLAKIVYAEPEEKLKASEIVAASRTLLQVNGALQQSQRPESGVTVNIGFLTATQPASVQVMPSATHLLGESPGASSESLNVPIDVEAKAAETLDK